MCWVVLVFFAGIVVILAMEPDTRMALAVTPVWFLVLGLVYQRFRTRARREALHS